MACVVPRFKATLIQFWIKLLARSDELTEKAEEKQEGILKKRRIDENRFAHIERHRLAAIIDSHMSNCGDDSTEIIPKEDEGIKIYKIKIQENILREYDFLVKIMVQNNIMPR